MPVCVRKCYEFWVLSKKKTVACAVRAKRKMAPANLRTIQNTNQSLNRIKCADHQKKPETENVHLTSEIQEILPQAGRRVRRSFVKIVSQKLGIPLLHVHGPRRTLVHSRPSGQMTVGFRMSQEYFGTISIVQRIGKHDVIVVEVLSSLRIFP